MPGKWQSKFKDSWGQAIKRPLTHRATMFVYCFIAYVAVFVPVGSIPYFSAVTSAVMRWQDPQLVHIETVSPMGSIVGSSQRLLQRLHEVKELKGIAAYRLQLLDSQVGRAVVAQVTDEFWTAVRVQPISGQWFSGVEKTGPQKAVVSEKFWRERLGEREGVIGQPLELEGKWYQIVGVAPLSETFRLDRVDVWIPMSLKSLPEMIPDTRFSIIARMAGDKHRVASQLTKLAKDEFGTWPNSQRLRRNFEAQSVGEVLRRNTLMRLFLIFLPFAIVLAPMAWSWAEQYKRWKGKFNAGRYFGFLAFKVCLFLTMLWGMSLAWASVYPLIFGEPILDFVQELTVSLGVATMALYAAQWIKQDQRVRCPVCLETLRMPIAAGNRGSVLLNRPQDEFICPHGHGYLTLQEEQLADEGASKWRKLESIWEDLASKR
jgi:hypothetical protein